MTKKLVMLFAAVCAAFSLSAAETAAPAKKAEKTAEKPAAKAKAKPKKKLYVIPADGGLKKSTTPTPRANPKAKEKGSWHKRYDEKLKLAAEYKNDVDIVFIGDSITHFWDKDAKLPSNPRHKTGGLDTYKKYFSKYKVINLGYSGDRTEHTLWVVNKSGYLKNLKAKMVVVMIGTNNVGHRRSTPAAAAAGITKIVEGLRTQLPDTKIVLFGVFPRQAPKHIYRKQVKEINDIICKLGDNKTVFYCDITDKFTDEKGNIPRSVMPDLLHPNDAGYEIWTKAMMPYIEKFVGKK